MLIASVHGFVHLYGFCLFSVGLRFTCMRMILEIWMFIIAQCLNFKYIYLMHMYTIYIFMIIYVCIVITYFSHNHMNQNLTCLQASALPSCLYRSSMWHLGCSQWLSHDIPNRPSRGGPCVTYWHHYHWHIECMFVGLYFYAIRNYTSYPPCYGFVWMHTRVTRVYDIASRI